MFKIIFFIVMVAYSICLCICLFFFCIGIWLLIDISSKNNYPDTIDFCHLKG